jgi:hypothetical protein
MVVLGIHIAVASQALTKGTRKEGAGCFGSSCRYNVLCLGYMHLPLVLDRAADLLTYPQPLPHTVGEPPLPPRDDISSSPLGLVALVPELGDVPAFPLPVSIEQFPALTCTLVRPWIGSRVSVAERRETRRRWWWWAGWSPLRWN